MESESFTNKPKIKKQCSFDSENEMKQLFYEAAKGFGKRNYSFINLTTDVPNSLMMFMK